MPAWVEDSIDWSALTIESGTLRFLISSQHASGVFEIGADDSVHAQPLDGHMSVASGSRALQLTADGKLRETLDAGHTFHEVQPPPGGAPRPEVDRLACRETGCILGPWYRLGWGGGAHTSR